MYVLTFVLQEGAVIDSEKKDAERALRLSSALTQKLLAYRFKTVSSVSTLVHDIVLHFF